MGQVLIRNLDDTVLACYRDRAKKKGRSLEAELRETLTESIKREHEAHLRDRQRLVKELEELASRQPPRQPGWPTIVEMIREDRDNR